jgi:alginate O-acetyltransferase complex protein AlgI
MFFNSHFYIFIFLPLTALIYFFLNRFRFLLAGRLVLLVASLVFYGWWHPAYVLLLLGSIGFNYLIGGALISGLEGKKGLLSHFQLALGVGGNILLLAYFKYADFFITNVNLAGGLKITLLQPLLPAGLSFFTLNQIGFLVDSWRGRIKEHHFFSYAQFVSFFPYILAGPIVRYGEVAPQLARQRNSLFDYRNASEGVFLFFIGLFKKVVIADSLAVWANQGFDAAATLTFVEAWITSLSYTLQLYFDFSGYTDMALGTALIFNVKLPINFNSPYKSLNIQEFWRRWHMTLGNFMRDYVYIPLGGSKVPEVHVLGNLMITFLLIGIWHGAGWTFIVWGCMHGAAMIVHRIWKRFDILIPRPIAWFLTFGFVNGAWIFFRAKDLEDAMKVLKGMIGVNGFVLPKFMEPLIRVFFIQSVSFGNSLSGINGNDATLLVVSVVLLLSVLFSNSNRMAEAFKPDCTRLSFIIVIAALSILYLGKYSEFLYFRF